MQDAKVYLLRLLGKRSSMLVLLGAYVALNLMPWRSVGHLAAYGFPITFLTTTVPRPTLTGERLSWLPGFSPVVGGVSVSGIAFDLLLGVLALWGMKTARRVQPVQHLPRQFRLRTLLLCVGMAACLAMLAAKCLKTSNATEDAIARIAALGGRNGTDWCGPELGRRLGLEPMFPGFDRVTALTLAGRNLSSEEVSELAQILERTQELQYLDLRKTNMSDADLVQLPRLPQLRLLLLNENSLNGRMLQEASIVESVERLDLSGSRAPKFTFPPLPICQSVVHLDLSECSIDTESLPNLQKLSALHRICIQNTGLQKVDLSKHLPQQREVYVDD